MDWFDIIKQTGVIPGFADITENPKEPVPPAPVPPAPIVTTVGSTNVEPSMARKVGGAIGDTVASYAGVDPRTLPSHLQRTKQKPLPTMQQQEQYERGAQDPYHRARVGAIDESTKPGKDASEEELAAWKEQLKQGNRAAMQSKLADKKEYQQWMKEQRSLAGKNKNPNIDTKDPMAMSAAKRGFKALGRGVKDWTGYGWGGRTGHEGKAAFANLAEWRKQRDAGALQTPAMPSSGSSASPTMLPDKVKDVLRGGKKPAEVEPPIQDPESEPKLEQDPEPAEKPDTPEPWGGFDIDPPTKEREVVEPLKPTTEQTLLGRNLEGHFLPKQGGHSWANWIKDWGTNKNTEEGASIHPDLRRQHKLDRNPTGASPTPAAIEHEKQKQAKKDKAEKESARTKRESRYSDTDIRDY
jgi:hypothetical protein